MMPPDALGCLEGHYWIVSSQAHDGEFSGYCKQCSLIRTWPQVPETTRWAYQKRGVQASQKARSP